jgi:hypothetical protein
MSRKHNCKHPERGVSNYPRRLSDRGVSSASVRMMDLDLLRRRAANRAKALEEGRPPEEDE